MLAAIANALTALVPGLVSGFGAGLVAQLIAVLTRVESAHRRRDYVIAGLVGTIGAILSIPLLMLLDWGRGAPIVFHLEPKMPQSTAIASTTYWIILKHLGRSYRWLVLASGLTPLALITLFVVLMRLAGQ